MTHTQSFDIKTYDIDFAIDGTTATTARQSGIFVALSSGKPILVPGRLTAAFEENR